MEGDFEQEDDVCASIIIVLLCFKYDVQFRFERQHMLCPFSHVCHILFHTDPTPQ